MPEKKKEEEAFGLIAVRDTVIVRPDEVEAKTASGILLGPETREKPYRGAVVAAGWDARYEVGCRLLYSKYGGNEIMEGDVTYVILEPAEVLAVEPADA